MRLHTLVTSLVLLAAVGFCTGCKPTAGNYYTQEEMDAYRAQYEREQSKAAEQSARYDKQLDLMESEAKRATDLLSTQEVILTRIENLITHWEEIAVKQTKVLQIQEQAMTSLVDRIKSP